MSSFINTNMNALSTMTQLNKTQNALGTAMERLASGKRINNASDDVAGIGIAARMLSQIGGMNQATRNAFDGVSLAQTAGGALSTSADMLQRMREMAVQASNGTNSPADRQALNAEFNQLLSGLNDIAVRASFNGQPLLDGTMAAQQFQVGPNAGDTVTVGGMSFLTNTYGNNTIQSDPVQPGTAVNPNAQFTITGALGSATISAAGTSASSVATAINTQSGTTGVTATATTQIDLNGLQAGGSYSFTLQSGTQTAGISFAVGEGADGLAQAVNAFNEQSGATGVTAQMDAVTGGIRLINASGDTVGLQAGANNPNGVTVSSVGAGGNMSTPEQLLPGGALVETVGTVTLQSPASFSVTETPGRELEGIAIAGGSQLQTIAGANINTFEDAQDALSTIDAALASLTAEQARYGAIQSRFEATINNMMVGAENTSASRSRVMDADYAQEATNRTRELILQNVGISMQAKANQSSEVVLSMLR